MQCKCRETWVGNKYTCRRTGVQHELLAGFIKGKAKGLYKTNKACPYHCTFCEHVAPILSQPKSLGKAFVAGPVVSMERPLDDHYLIHLPKHPGCKACNNCKVQRKHCRDKEKAKKRKLERSIKLSPSEDKTDPEAAAPKQFGDLVTSDSVFVLRKNLTSPARHGGSTALVIRDRGTGDDVIPSKEQIC